MKSYLSVIVVIAVLLLAGCDKVSLTKFFPESAPEDTIVCNRPYIRFADTCCLDRNRNYICDGDEGLPTELPAEEEPEAPAGPAAAGHEEPAPGEQAQEETPEAPEEPVADPCAGITCPAVCDGTTRKFNGQCVNGGCQYETQVCETGCESGACVGQDPCEGVTCAATCDGTTRKYNGTCAAGVCQYATEACQFGCTNGACDADPCIGVTCAATCDGSTRKYNGTCANGVCHYVTEACQFGCTNGACDADPCAGITCPAVCDGTTRKYNGQCVAGACQYATEACQFGCTGGVCNADPCAGVTCPNLCSDAGRHYNGQCVGGACQYTIEKCQNGCTSGACNTGLTVYRASVSVNGNLGSWSGAGGTKGITAGNAICTYTAAQAGLSGTFKAWLSDSNLDAKERFKTTNKPYYLVGKGKVGNNLADLLDGSIERPINLFEDGSTTDYVESWTGTSSQGLKLADTCGNWRNSSVTSGGTISAHSYTTGQWTQWAGGSSPCNGPHHLICMQDEWTEYYCEWSWPQKVIVKATGAVVATCTSARPYCSLTAALDGVGKCCKYDSATETHYDCVSVP